MCIDSLKTYTAWAACTITVVLHVFTDDYQIGVQFHTLEGSNMLIIHQGLIKVAFNSHKILSQKKICMPSSCVALSRFNSQPQACKFWDKESVLGGSDWIVIIALQQRWVSWRAEIHLQAFPAFKKSWVLYCHSNSHYSHRLDAYCFVEEMHGLLENIVLGLKFVLY